MAISDIMNIVRSGPARTAWAVAIAADAIQILVMPLFAFGAISPADTIVDVVTAALLTRLIGWHWAFLPTLLAELIPGLDLFPTWTAAVAYVTWRDRRQQEDIREIRDVRHVN